MYTSNNSFLSLMNHFLHLLIPKMNVEQNRFFFKLQTCTKTEPIKNEGLVSLPVIK